MSISLIEAITIDEMLKGQEAQIVSLSAENERLREAVAEHIAYADLQDQDQINRGFTVVTYLRAALQPKDGNQ